MTEDPSKKESSVRYAFKYALKETLVGGVGAILVVLGLVMLLMSRFKVPIPTIEI